MKSPLKCPTCAVGALLVLALATGGIWFILHAKSAPAPAPQTNTAQPSNSGQNINEQATLPEMIRYGQETLAQLKDQGTDVSSGPCIDDGETFPGWVIDIAHSPRVPADDQPENQCPAYREGRASHFLELTPDGVFIRASQ